MISVIIPFYDGNKYLNKLDEMLSKNVESLNRKCEVEVVLVNDSPWIEVDIEKLKGEVYKLTLINNESNLGIHGSRVQGIKNASGEYILMLDQDDRISDSCLLEHYTNIGNADVSVSDGYRYSKEKTFPIYGSIHQHNKVKNIFYYVYLENRILSPGQCLIKKESIPADWYEVIIRKNGADDMLLWVMMLGRKANFTIQRKKLYTHVFTGENVSADNLKMADSTNEMLEIIKRKRFLSKRMAYLLKRKIQNDICYARTGKDKFLDYRIIELIRKLLSRTR